MKAECKEVQGFAEDPAITRLIANHKEKAIRLLSEPVGELEQRLSVSWKEESPFGNLLAEAIRKWTGADLALVNSGLLLSDLHPGAVTKKDLLEILPHPINPCTVKMKGTDIIRILEASLDPDMIDKKLIGFGFRGYVHGWVCVDNIEIHYDPSTERGSQIKKVLHNGRPLSENEYYVVATTDMYTFGHIFPQFQRAEDVRFFVPEFIREVMQKELADLAVRPQQIKKWWVNT